MSAMRSVVRDLQKEISDKTRILQKKTKELEDTKNESISKISLLER
jgi:hypothetical protein